MHWMRVRNEVCFSPLTSSSTTGLVSFMYHRATLNYEQKESIVSLFFSRFHQLKPITQP